VILRLRGCSLFLLIGIFVAACTGSTAAQGPNESRPSPPAIIYAAIGASETVGVGAAHPLRDAWPQVFYRTALPESSVFYNFGVPGATVASALANQVPEAVSVQPTLVTVWLNVNDLVAGVSASDYEDELDLLVHALRRGGEATVLIANTPYLDRLPVYLDCRAGTAPPGIDCPPGLSLISPEQVNAEVSAYNSAIFRVAQREGAILVDLHAQGEVADAHPDWVSGDGFHPSTNGYTAIAGIFATAFKQATRPAA
jgi:acyl-CoA thioesterase I